MTSSATTRSPGAEHSTANSDGPAIDRAITKYTSAPSAAGTNVLDPDSRQSSCPRTALVRTKAGSQAPDRSATANVAVIEADSIASRYPAASAESSPIARNACHPSAAVQKKRE